MDSALKVVRHTVVPAGAALFLLLWVFAESGRGDINVVVCVLFAGAIAASR